MEHIKRKLLKESINFIEICQVYTLKGNINIETYSSLVNIKLKFLKNMLELENTKMYIDKKFSSRIEDVFKTDNYLLN